MDAKMEDATQQEDPLEAASDHGENGSGAQTGAQHTSWEGAF